MEQPSLPKLLSALALGARSVNSIPLSNDGKDEEDFDDFAYNMALPEFATLNNEARQLLSSLLSKTMRNVSPSWSEENADFDDPSLWENCAEACDELRDRVLSYLPNANLSQQSEILNVATKVGDAKHRAFGRASGSYARMVSATASMEKPQHLYQGFVTHPPQNSRGEPFVPTIFDPIKQAKLDAGEWNVNGHGRNITKRKYANDMIASSYHVDHPFRDEIETLEYRPWQLSTTGIRKQESVKVDVSDQGVWIGSEEELTQLANRICEGQKNDEIREIALDLEAHSYRSFAGFVCLIQLSIRRPQSGGGQGAYDFLIDALSLRHVIATSLGPIFANPKILKVMHGADSDIPWLQKDFGLYIVNLFDTGRASRTLKLSSAGLAYLLRKYAGIDPDKTHQLSDWRRRPLPDDMRTYACSDTRYLLDIYDQLRLELENNPSPDVSIEEVLDMSKQVCLIRYDKEPFFPSAYKSLLNKKGKVINDLTPRQDAALKALYDWRDIVARTEDESLLYVCPTATLVRIASNNPKTVDALQRLVNPTPPLVMRRSQEILDAVAAASLTSKGFPKPDVTSRSPTAAKNPNIQMPTPRSREMLSPILVSDKLFESAGWMSPRSDYEEAAHHLDVGASNKGYSSNAYSSHSIELSPPALTENFDKRGLSTSGHGILGKDEVARGTANTIHNRMMLSGENFGGNFSLMDLIRPYAQSINLDQEAKEQTTVKSSNKIKSNAPEEDEMKIPKSIGEIFCLSNSNRGKQKDKSKPPQFKPDTNARKMKEDDILAAESIIASSGGSGGYFGSTKRHKTQGKDGDIKQLIKLGYVKDQKDAESLAEVPEQPPDQGKPAASSSYDSSNMVGAYNPNSSPSKNPFFSGSAAAGTMPLFGGDSSKHSKNKKRSSFLATD